MSSTEASSFGERILKRTILKNSQNISETTDLNAAAVVVVVAVVAVVVVVVVAVVVVDVVAEAFSKTIHYLQLLFISK